MKKLLNRLFWVVVAVVVAGYGVIIWWFHAHETELIFSPDREFRVAADSLGLQPARVIVFATDGVSLVGRVYRSTRPDSAGFWILYFHGNAGNATGRAMFHAGLLRLGFNVLVAEYRGYGESGGSPDEEGVYRDADAFYAYARDTLGIPPGRLILYGHSLGSAVAIDLATRRPAAGLIVEGGFTSVPDRGQELYPYLPIQMMARNRFASIEKISSVAIPKLFLHALDDEVIPIAHGRRLFENAVPPKSFQELRGGHNAPYQVDAHIFFGAIGTFVSRCNSPKFFIP
jgi:fermentation-respiration switch protein FrsA (DUF1100 family)